MNLLIQWKNRSYTLVHAEELLEACVRVDEWGNPFDCQVAVLHRGDFSLDFESHAGGVVTCEGDGDEPLRWMPGAEFFGPVRYSLFDTDDTTPVDIQP